MNFNNWDKLAEVFSDTIDEVVRKTAFDGMANVQAQIQVDDLIDTGFMMGSIYVVTAQESTYGQGGQPPKGGYLLPEVEKPEDSHTAYIAAGASYTIYPNYGTVYQHGYGFWETGIDKTMAGFDAAMAAINKKLEEVRS